MKKLLTGALALSMITTMSMAENGFYVGGGTAIEMVEGSYNGSTDTGTALELKVGKIFSNNFGIEGKITKTISPAKVDMLETSSTYYPDVEVDITTFSLWAMYQYNITSDFSILPKIGFVKADFEFTASNGVSLPKSNDSKVAMGIEVKKNLPTLGFDIYAGYDYLASDVQQLSFGIQKSF